MTQLELDAFEEGFAKNLLERSLSTELIEAGARKSTDDLHELKHFVEHCRDFGVTPLPATPAVCGMYLLTLIAGGHSERSVTKAATAIAYAHDTHGHANPIATRWVKAVMRINKTHSRRSNEVHH